MEIMKDFISTTMDKYLLLVVRKFKFIRDAETFLNLQSNTDGDDNTALEEIGFNNNTALGRSALLNTGAKNTAVGAYALGK